MCDAKRICFMLFRSFESSARSFALLKAGSNMLARMAMIAMTTRSSMRVKAEIRNTAARVLGDISRD
jgi:hypothetical protein